MMILIHHRVDSRRSSRLRFQKVAPPQVVSAPGTLVPGRLGLELKRPWSPEDGVAGGLYAPEMRGASRPKPISLHPL